MLKGSKRLTSKFSFLSILSIVLPVHQFLIMFEVHIMKREDEQGAKGREIRERESEGKVVGARWRG